MGQFHSHLANTQYRHNNRLLTGIRQRLCDLINEYLIILQETQPRPEDNGQLSEVPRRGEKY